MEVFMTEDKNLVIVDNREIQNMIYAIRGKQVMVDSDLATLYQVTTKRLNEQVRRNKNRFPSIGITNTKKPKSRMIVALMMDRKIYGNTLPIMT